MRQAHLTLHAAVIAAGSVVGKKEFEGPLGGKFDLHDNTARFDRKTWEGAESEMQRRALSVALSKAGLNKQAVDALFAGDLLNQCVGSAYGLLEYGIPYFGLYGACSTSAEGLLLASLAIGGGCRCCGVVTSSHYCAAERQYRTPLEYGSQRPPTAQWTVTGAGAFLLGHAKDHPTSVRLTAGMPGIPRDLGIKDANNMGAAMAPAAADTLCRFFASTETSSQDYDGIFTGDLGHEGGTLLCDLLRAEGHEISHCYDDCGKLIFAKEEQDVHGGGSGCGCSASVLAAHILPQLKQGVLHRVLFLATGAMMSPDSLKQGENIPAIAHLVELRAPVEAPNEERN